MPFTWSYSKIKNSETCPHRYQQVDVLKNFKDTSEQLDWGDTVHKAFAKAISTRTPLPDALKDLQPWIGRVTDHPGEILVEQKYAITKDFQPTEYFGPKVWYRGIGDVVRIYGPVADITDWKTGKIKTDPVQLMLMAQCVFAFHPEIKRIRAQFAWIQEDTMTGETFNRRDMAKDWASVLPRVRALEAMHTSGVFPKKPGHLCKNYCPVKSCEHNGRK
jgi:hypothetical protein